MKIKTKNTSEIIWLQEKMANNYQMIAKTFFCDGKKHPGRTVFEHGMIVGTIARAILGRIPVEIYNKIYPKNSELLAALHDIGKISPTFFKKIWSAIDSDFLFVKDFEQVDPLLEKKWGGHAGTGELSIRALDKGPYLGQIIGRHHGFSPNLAGKRVFDECFGSEEWQYIRVETVKKLLDELHINEWPSIKTEEQALVISGLVTVCDWIGSSSFFEDPSVSWKETINNVLDQIGLISPKIVRDLSFKDIFKFDPRPIQQKLIENISGPGLYILEAPMGVGKTEAALYVSYKILSLGKATGIYFALPTQVTSNKIYDRLELFLKSILEVDSFHSHAMLLHGNASLYLDMGEEGAPGGSWFNENKRGILAPFAVGTIDQVLMAAMNVKHGFVRAYGLVGKVVILDEVHSYDSYTGTLLNCLIKLLRKLECTIIILSATLSKVRIEELLGISPQFSHYPAITTLPCNEEKLNEIEVPESSTSNVQLDHILEDEKALDIALEKAKLGEQVLWIENCVEKAQQIYKYLSTKIAADHLDIECGLLHSRFTKGDRKKKEDYWVSLYGKGNLELRSLRGRILVGTQVLEQSLDIDADLLITRFCPTDMLLQRIGRLWRHKETLRPKGALRQVLLLIPDLNKAISSPKENFGKTFFIYSPYVLCRSLEVFSSLKNISLPSDIRMLIEKTYEKRLEYGEMAKLLYQLENGDHYRKGRRQLQSLAWIGIAKEGKTLSEEKASTRYSSEESIDVLLLRSFYFDVKNKFISIELIDGEKLNFPIQGRFLEKKKRKEFSLKMIRNTVTIPYHLAPPQVSVPLLEKFKDYLYLGEGELSFRIVSVSPGNELIGPSDCLLLKDCKKNCCYSYDFEIGYQLIF